MSTRTAYLFKANLHSVCRHQLLDPSVLHDVTKFSDVTPVEFCHTYLDLRKSHRMLLGEHGDSTHKAPVLPTDDLLDDFDRRDHSASLRDGLRSTKVAMEKYLWH
jgi:cathepsin F